jgi:hypothetical protein
MPTKKPDTKIQLFNKIQELEAHNKKLMLTLGRIRNGVQSVVFPHEHRETMDEVMEQIDRAIDAM